MTSVASISEVTFEEYVNSSKAYVGIVMIIYVMYAVFDILRFFKTDGGKESPEGRVNNFMRAYIYVVEKDIAVPMLIITAVITSRAFYIFMAIFTYVLIMFAVVMVFGRLKENKMLQTICKIVMVVVVIMAFINIFVDNHYLHE